MTHVEVVRSMLNAIHVNALSRVEAFRGFRCGQNSISDNRQNIPTPRPTLVPPRRDLIATQILAMALATKTQSQTIFAKLKAKPANKVRMSKKDIHNMG
jgi:hypothetical protein